MNFDFELAARLRDAHPPEAPPWWPPAPGWWLAIIVLLVLAAIAVRHLRPRWRRFLLRRRLLAALAGELTEMPYRAPRAGDDVAPLRAAARGWLRAAV